MITYTCRGPRLVRVDEDGTRVVRPRSGCGFDLTSLIMDLPRDGEEHAVACPHCGTVGRHRRT